ncbi:MAG: periplasmic heavy metal sensor [Deltaproteobacteria bacterium]|nr:periplasmic heavy metal sensor [Candidatus Anaeroferrophillus wilburensis]MBN2888704.1 periplasmic heavy metal sensor [Deltaproteobacteria bacterium]
MTKKIKLLLLLSLLGNVFLGGLIIGRWSHRSLPAAFFGPRRFADVGEQFPAASRELVLATLEKVHQQNRPLHQEMRAAREAAIVVLTAPEFEEQEYRRLAGSLQSLRGRLMNRLVEATIQLANQLDQDDRRLLAELVRRPPYPPGRKYGGYANRWMTDHPVPANDGR